MEKLSEKIVKKDFNKKQIGYDAYEVDVYLDKIIEEVVKLENSLESAKKEIERLNVEKSRNESTMSRLQVELNQAKAGSVTRSNCIDGQSNLDIIQRLSNLEKMVDSILKKMDK